MIWPNPSPFGSPAIDTHACMHIITNQLTPYPTLAYNSLRILIQPVYKTEDPVVFLTYTFLYYNCTLACALMTWGCW